MKISTGIVTDFMASSMATSQEERIEIANVLKTWGLDIDVKYSEDAISGGMPKLDLLVIDYGGLSGMGSDGMVTFQVKAALQWAKEHPGALLIIWSSYTWRIYHYELEQEFGHLDNVKFRYPPTDHYVNVNEEQQYQDKMEDFVRLWFSATKPQPEPMPKLVVPPTRFTEETEQPATPAKIHGYLVPNRHDRRRAAAKARRDRRKK
ncbi:MAG: hypothetical protein ACYC3H_01280 [Bellilinea sp.]